MVYSVTMLPFDTSNVLSICTLTSAIGSEEYRPLCMVIPKCQPWLGNIGMKGPQRGSCRSVIHPANQDFAMQYQGLQHPSIQTFYVDSLTALTPDTVGTKTHGAPVTTVTEASIDQGHQGIIHGSALVS
jgi:hypothetical protein